MRSGMASPPAVNSIFKAIPDHEQPEPAWFPLNRTLGYHDASDCFRALDKFLRQDLGEPCCLAEYLWMGDLYNSQCYRAIFEAANKARPRNAGTHLWKVNAAWPSMMWQVFDWYLRPNAGYYSMRSACRPLHVQASRRRLEGPGRKHSCRKPAGLKLASSWSMPRAKKISIASTRWTPRPTPRLPQPRAGTAQRRPAPLPPLDPADSAGRKLDCTVTWVQQDCRWQELMARPATVKVRVLRRGEENGETHYDLCVENISPLPAVNVWVQVLRSELGDEVLPTFWSDNALTLLPGEKRDSMCSSAPACWQTPNPGS